MNGDKAMPKAGGGNLLDERRRQLRSVLDEMDDAYYEVDLRGRITGSNPALYRMLGYRPDELLVRDNRDLQSAEMGARVYRIFNEVYRTGVRATWDEWDLVCKDGSVVTVEGSVHLMRDGEGKPIGFCGILRDVTERRRNEEALRAGEERYRSIIESIRDAYYEVDVSGCMVLCNEAFCRMLGYRRDEIIGMSNRALQRPADAAEVYRIFHQVFTTGVAVESFDWRMRRKDGGIVTGEGSVQPVRALDGAIIGFRGILRDVTERRHVEHALRESEARFRALTNLSSDWYWEQDAECRYTRMEGRGERAARVQAAFLGKRPWETLLVPEDGDWPTLRKLMAQHQPFRDVVLQRRLRDGSAFYISASGEPVFDAEGTFIGYRGVTREITSQKLAEERIQHLASHDALTGLPNRSLFSQLLAMATSAAQRNNRRFALLFIDLDRFKAVNDNFGHDVGDELLRQVSARLRAVLRGEDLVARLGGDEFVVLMQDVRDAVQPLAVARKLLEVASEPMLLCGRECRVTASIGMALYPEHGTNEQDLLKNADMAMYQAKEEGRDGCRFFSDHLLQQATERLTMENALRGALGRDEFSLHYQPRRRLDDLRVTGVEALLRWDNPALGRVSPERFIPLAEETGLIIAIGKWVLQRACEQAMAWRRAGLPPLVMAVNLSVRQFADPVLVEDLAAVLHETGLPPSLLELEITEGMVVQHPDQALATLQAIKALGVRLAIDDFGSGYSSLGQLKHFPVDTLKMDRSFIHDLAGSARDEAIVEAIIAIGRTLELTVVAEGVETGEQANFLREHGCDEIQGYYFSQALPPVEAEQLLRRFAGDTS